MAFGTYISEKQAAFIQDYKNLELLAKAIFGSQSKPSTGTIDHSKLPVFNDPNQVRAYLESKKNGR